ncbi:MAG: radical SAM protein [Candidatus Kerfeldbacteria bacterium]
MPTENNPTTTTNAPLPVDAVIGITYNCNSKCVMCDIWQMKPQEEMTLADFAKIPTTLKDVNISGGEPFLHKDIVGIIKTVHERVPNARIVISTNGFATKLIEMRMKEIVKFMPNIRISISIDGMEKMHDEIRRIPNGFQKAMATLDMLKNMGVTDIRLAFTVSTINVADLPKVYDLANKKGVQFTMAFAQSSDFYFGGKQNYENPDPKLLKQGFQYVVTSELKSPEPKRWARAYFEHGLYQFATTGKQPLAAKPGTDFFYLDPTGIIYPSVVHFHSMGNIKDYDTFEELWNAGQAEEARAEVEKDKKQYWMICTARSAIRRHPLQVGKWILRNKLMPGNVLK